MSDFHFLIRRNMRTVRVSLPCGEHIRRMTVYREVQSLMNRRRRQTRILIPNIPYNINGEYVPQMNYRFDTRVATSEGITTNSIGDWGGEHEWEIDY